MKIVLGILFLSIAVFLNSIELSSEASLVPIDSNGSDPSSTVHNPAPTVHSPAPTATSPANSHQNNQAHQHPDPAQHDQNIIRNPAIFFYVDEFGKHRIEPGRYTVGIHDDRIRGIVINGRLCRVLGYLGYGVAVHSRTGVPHMFDFQDNITFGQRAEHTPGISFRIAVITERYFK
ncbi:uncharacterized protein LOC117174787 [Belonocnema kinseyi]|uniref:uncharacterized protein LOC117174787 n=1 Tax=Belonocnema kinseyi TaxID=2817044 RepID=UPI00143D256D|nr:uncharacterized protein LOC117174787 [Belonocnema kinseyi]